MAKAKVTDETKARNVKGVPESLWREVKAAAALAGKPLNQYIVDVLGQAVGWKPPAAKAGKGKGAK